jgi:propanediol utilization protein
VTVIPGRAEERRVLPVRELPVGGPLLNRNPVEISITDVTTEGSLTTPVPVGRDGNLTGLVCVQIVDKQLEGLSLVGLDEAEQIFALKLFHG